MINLGFIESKKWKTEIHKERNEKVFVIMPFAKKYQNLYINSIKKPLEELNFICERFDEINFSGNIMKKLYEKIENAWVIIAIMTDNNPNVYYEVGYAHALNKDVILLIKNSEDIPFDLKDHRHIIYGSGYKKLKQELIAMLTAIK